jgi:phosphoadenosine phosphosulfate reductase
VECLDHEISEKSRGQAVNSLLSTFRDSPIGSALQQCIQIDKSYLRAGWDYPHAVALLYALYLYAERTGRRSFTYTELVNSHSNPDAVALSPHDIYGIDPKAFREHLQGLAMNYPKYIRVSFVANLDNIILENYSSVDVIDLAEE